MVINSNIFNDELNNAGKFNNNDGLNNIILEKKIRKNNL